MKEQIGKMLEYNKVFVEHELYKKYTTTKYPDRKIAILACMDTRMTELLPAALGLKNGDVKLIKTAGGRVLHPYGSVIFSLLVAVYEMGVDTVLVIGHDDCGGSLLNGRKMIEEMKERTVDSAFRRTLSTMWTRTIKIWRNGFRASGTSAVLCGIR